MAAEYDPSVPISINLEWIEVIEDSRFEHTGTHLLTAWCVPWETSESFAVRLQTWLRETKVLPGYPRAHKAPYCIDVRFACDTVMYKGKGVGKPDGTPIGRIITDPGMRQIGIDGGMCITNCCSCCLQLGPTQRPMALICVCYPIWMIESDLESH